MRVLLIAFTTQMFDRSKDYKGLLCAGLENQAKQQISKQTYNQEPSEIDQVIATALKHWCG